MQYRNIAEALENTAELSRTIGLPSLVTTMLKLQEEAGELAEAVLIQEGYITHKIAKEPLVGEVADVIQCAMTVLAKANPDLSPIALVDALTHWLSKKNTKWYSVYGPRD